MAGAEAEAFAFSAFDLFPAEACKPSDASNALLYLDLDQTYCDIYKNQTKQKYLD
jgi:hypothetical protein